MTLAGTLVLLAAGPPLAQWWQARHEGPSPHRLRPEVSAPTDVQPAGTETSPPAGVQRGVTTVNAPVDVQPEVTLPRVGEPVAAPAGDDPDARAAREAFALYQQGQIATACERYRELLSRGWREDEVRRSLGRCHARLGQDAYRAGRPAEAVEHYRRAVDASSDRTHWAGLAIAHGGAGELARGQAVLERALQAFPEDPELLYLLAVLQERQGRTREAVDTLRRLVARESRHPGGRALLARLEREQGVESGYWSQESPHFLVRYEGGAGIDVGRSVIDTLERAYESLGRDLGVYPKDRVQVGIYATRTFAEIGGIPPEVAEHVLGFYDSQKLRLRLSASPAGSTGLERLARHEYAHLLIHQATRGNAPRWLHEGLAQVVEPRAAPRFIQLDSALDRQQFTLAALEGLFRSNAAGAAYQLSHVACELLAERRGMAGVRALLGHLGQGEPMPRALEASLGLGVEDVEARLLAVGGRS